MMSGADDILCDTPGTAVAGAGLQPLVLHHYFLSGYDSKTTCAWKEFLRLSSSSVCSLPAALQYTIST